MRRRPLPALAAGMVGVLLLGFAAFVMGTHPLWGVVLALGALRCACFPSAKSTAPGWMSHARLGTDPTPCSTPNARALCALAERQGERVRAKQHLRWCRGRRCCRRCSWAPLPRHWQQWSKRVLLAL